MENNRVINFSISIPFLYMLIFHMHSFCIYMKIYWFFYFHMCFQL